MGNRIMRLSPFNSYETKDGWIIIATGTDAREAIYEGWGKRISFPRFLEETFGKNHDKPTGEAWLDQPDGMTRIVVGAAYGRSRLGKQALPRLLNSLNEPNAYFRAKSLQNVEQVLGRSLSESEYRLTAPPAERRVQVERLLKKVSDR